MDVDFELVGEIAEIETIAVGPSIRELRGGTIRFAEVHWYEAHGIGKVRMKIKRYLD